MGHYKGEALDTQSYPCMHRLLNTFSTTGQQESYLMTRLRGVTPETEQTRMLRSWEDKFYRLSRYQGYEQTCANLLNARSWDEFQEHAWTLQVALHLADRRLLQCLEVSLPNDRIVDMVGETSVKGIRMTFYVEAKSWRFDRRRPDYSDVDVLQADERVARMVDKLSRQLPNDALGVWAWDKMRDGVGGGMDLTSGAQTMGVQERRIADQVCSRVPQIAVVAIKLLDPRGLQSSQLSDKIQAFPSLRSKWSSDLVTPLVQALNADVTLDGTPPPR